MLHLAFCVVRHARSRGRRSQTAHDQTERRYEQVFGHLGPVEEEVVVGIARGDGKGPLRLGVHGVEAVDRAAVFRRRIIRVGDDAEVATAGPGVPARVRVQGGVRMPSARR